MILMNFAPMTTQYMIFIGFFLFLYMRILKGVGSPQSQHGGLVLSDVCNMWNTGLVKIKAFHKKSQENLVDIISLDCAVDVLVKLPEWKML